MKHIVRIKANPEVNNTSSLRPRRENRPHKQDNKVHFVFSWCDVCKLRLASTQSCAIKDHPKDMVSLSVVVKQGLNIGSMFSVIKRACYRLACNIEGPTR